MVALGSVWQTPQRLHCAPLPRQARPTLTLRALLLKRTAFLVSSLACSTYSEAFITFFSMLLIISPWNRCFLLQRRLSTTHLALT